MFSIQQGRFQMSNVDRLHSFTDSYMLGLGIIKGDNLSKIWILLINVYNLYPIFLLILPFGFPGLGVPLSSLDAQLAPEHLLRLCLEHERKFVSSHKSACRYNFYKVLKTLGSPYFCL